jgi:hypothetical protein
MLTTMAILMIMVVIIIGQMMCEVRVIVNKFTRREMTGPVTVKVTEARGGRGSHRSSSSSIVGDQREMIEAVTVAAVVLVIVVEATVVTVAVVEVAVIAEAIVAAVVVVTAEAITGKSL